MKKAVVLLSGGLDSTVCLYKAVNDGFDVYALTICYGQRHSVEILKAKISANLLAKDHVILDISLPWKGSALLDTSIELPRDRDETDMTDIPSTYVPARNTLFLSYALSNQIDYSGYPDCRKEFLDSIEKTFCLGTKQGVEGNPVKIYAPLLDLNKAEIVKLGDSLKVPFGNTWSCYAGGAKPCGKCDSCVLRAKGFKDAGVDDALTPTS